MRMNVYKVEIMVIDFDQLGEGELKNVIENTRYPNRCIRPEVKSIQTRVVEWSDDHPLNSISQSDAEYRRIFAE